MKSILIYHADYDQEFMSYVRCIRNTRSFDNYSITSVVSSNGDSNLDKAFPRYQVLAIDVSNDIISRQQLIEEASIVISFLKGQLHLKIAKECFTHETQFINANGKTQLSTINEMCRVRR